MLQQNAVLGYCDILSGPVKMYSIGKELSEYYKPSETIKAIIKHQAIFEKWVFFHPSPQELSSDTGSQRVCSVWVPET